MKLLPLNLLLAWTLNRDGALRGVRLSSELQLTGGSFLSSPRRSIVLFVPDPNSPEDIRFVAFTGHLRPSSCRDNEIRGREVFRRCPAKPSTSKQDSWVKVISASATDQSLKKFLGSYFEQSLGTTCHTMLTMLLERRFAHYLKLSPSQ